MCRVRILLLVCRSQLADRTTGLLKQDLHTIAIFSYETDID